MIETLRSVALANECDANGHLNVASYVDCFSQAGQNFFSANGQAHKTYYPVDRHFRFHQELHANTPITVNSIVVGRGAKAGHLLHILRDANRNNISATCLDAAFCPTVKKLPVSKSGSPVIALPKGIPDTEVLPAKVGPLLKRRLAIKGGQGRIDNLECYSDGLMKHGRLVEKFFNSANHLWQYVGFGADWLKENSLGPAALEMKFSIHRRIKVNQDYDITSWVPALDNRFMRLSHQMATVPGGKPLASISALAFLMNLENRTPGTIPDDIKSRYDARFLSVGELVDF